MVVRGFPEKNVYGRSKMYRRHHLQRYPLRPSSRAKVECLRVRHVSRLNARTLRSMYPVLISSTSSPASDPTATAFPTSPRRERGPALPTKLESPVEVDTIELMFSSTDTVFRKGQQHRGSASWLKLKKIRASTRRENHVSAGDLRYYMTPACSTWRVVLRTPSVTFGVIHSVFL